MALISMKGYELEKSQKGALSLLFINQQTTNMYLYKAKIMTVYDGDTVTALVDLGFHVQKTIKVRLFGIDTPEIRGIERPEGLDAKKRLAELIEGKEVIVKTFKDKQEKYGRWLGIIFLPDDQLKSINDILVEEGFAKEYSE